jgi:hypothetical protein
MVGKKVSASLRYFIWISVYMAGETGLEPATPGFGDRCSTN